MVPPTLTRRSLLAGAGATVALALAGCTTERSARSPSAGASASATAAPVVEPTACGTASRSTLWGSAIAERRRVRIVRGDLADRGSRVPTPVRARVGDPVHRGRPPLVPAEAHAGLATRLHVRRPDRRVRRGQRDARPRGASRLGRGLRRGLDGRRPLGDVEAARRRRRCSARSRRPCAATAAGSTPGSSRTRSWTRTGRARTSPGTRRSGRRTSATRSRSPDDADPDAELLINDYGFETDVDVSGDAAFKREEMLAYVDDLLADDVPVTALGVQAHLLADGFEDAFDAEAYRAFLRGAEDRGLHVLVTEMDVLDDGLPADPAARDTAVADVVRRYLEVALSEPVVSTVVSFGLSDRYTWLEEDYPRDDGAPRRPLPFDDAMAPKPAFDAFHDVLVLGDPARAALGPAPLLASAPAAGARRPTTFGMVRRPANERPRPHGVRPRGSTGIRHRRRLRDRPRHRRSDSRPRARRSPSSTSRLEVAEADRDRDHRGGGRAIALAGRRPRPGAGRGGPRPRARGVRVAPLPREQRRARADVRARRARGGGVGPRARHEPQGDVPRHPRRSLRRSPRPVVARS